MAITFIDSNVQDAAAALSLTFTVPGSAQADDFLIAFVKQSENTSQRTWDDDGGGGNGWTRLTYNRTTGGRDQETAIYYKIHSGSESNPTFTWASGVTTEPMSGTLLVYRGVDVNSPITNFGYANGQNDANPRNPSVVVDSLPSTILTFHAATHDDISSVAPPTGYTLRSQVWSGTANDHRNHFTSDLIGFNTSGGYTPPDWQHSVLNTTPEFHTYTVVLQEQQAIGVFDFDGDNAFNWGESNKVLTGFGFEANQGSGKVEFWSDSVGTIKQVQSVDSWSDGIIQIDSVQGSLLNDTTIYLVVTNNNGDVSSPVAIGVGLLPYAQYIESLSPDHIWTLDNNYDDSGITGPQRNMVNSVVGGGAFVANPLCEGVSNCWHENGVLVRREITDSPNMNVTISSKERTVSTWVQLNGVQQSLGAIWKEGGGVQNLAFLVGLGNVLMWQLADVAGSRDNVQAVSGFRLAVGRPYDIVGRYSHLDDPKEARLYIDGRIQPIELTDGNPMTLGIFDSHSGDVTWGDPDNNLETGGTDIAYAGQEDTYLNYFKTWSDNSANGGALTDAQILDKFRRGARPKDIITTDTQANMQTAIDNTDDTRIDWPLSYRIEAPTGSNDLTLTLNNKDFNSRISDHLEWRGGGTLTLILVGNTSFDIAKSFALNGGIINTVIVGRLTLTGLKDGTEVRILEGGTTNEITGQESVIGGTYTADLSNPSIDIVIHSLGQLNRKIKNIDMSLGDVTLPINQRKDRQYANN